MAAGSVESRISNIEELVIIIIIIVFGGGGRPGGGGPVGDTFSSDTTRLDAVMRALRGPIRGDPPAVDLTRMPEEAVESRLLEVNAELTRLRSQEAELSARLKELRANKSR
jgi:hypothetical protein